MKTITKIFIFCFAALFIQSVSPKPIKNKHIFIIDRLPASITKAGNWQLSSSLEFDAQANPSQERAITIFADDVYLDFNHHTVDMQGKAGTAIVLDGVARVTISNGIIKNSGNPGPLPPAPLALNLPWFGQFTQEDLDYFINNNPAFPNTTPSAWPTVCAMKPLNGVGIAVINGCNDITIENMTFEEIFIGIFGMSSTQNGTDGSSNITINNCRGIKCGSSIDRGGAFVTFGTLTFQGSHNLADYDDNSRSNGLKIFKNIQISNCNVISHTQSHTFFLSCCNQCLVQNCSIPKDAWGSITLFMGYDSRIENMRTE